MQKGCFPIPETSRHPFQASCVANKKAYWDFLAQTSADAIVAARWRLNLVGDRFDNQEGGVEYGTNGLNFVLANSESLIAHSAGFLTNVAASRNLYLINQIPEAGWNVPDTIAMSDELKSRDLTTSYDVYKEKNTPLIEMLATVEALSDAVVIRTDKLICSEESRRCLNSIESQSLYRDDDHPSKRLSKMISTAFEDLAFIKSSQGKRENANRVE